MSAPGSRRGMVAELIITALWVPIAVMTWGSLFLVIFTPLMFLACTPLLGKMLRPRPDYAAIARMEREIWGETLEPFANCPECGRTLYTRTQCATC